MTDSKSEINFDKFRKPWELDDYWHLKKQFLETYKNDYELNRLLALGQTFINIEVMGNTYDESIMALIRRLTEEWESLRQFRENKQIHINEQKKNLIKSKQVENEKKRLKTELNSSDQSNNNNRSFDRRDKNRQNNYNKPFTFGTQSVYSSDTSSYNSNSNFRNNKRY